MRAFPPEFAAAADRSACRAAIRAGSKSFFAAGRLLPGEVRNSAYGLYAFCRLSDDLVDGATSRRDRLAAVERLGVRVGLAYAGAPADTPADRAFSELVRLHAIPEALPRALIEGLAWDAQGRRYPDLPALHAYAARVAGSVGAMMAVLMGVRGADALARACDLGAAMQLTNIARDVGEDARMGRIYLPLDWLAEAGIDPEAFLADPRPGPALAGLVDRLLAEADRLYARAEPGIHALPADCRPAIRAAALIYAEIGRAVGANGCDSVTRRARVGGLRKAALLLRAALPRAATPGLAGPTLPEAAFLVAAVTGEPAGHALRRGGSAPPWWNVGGRVAHVLDLIERMRAREALGRQTS